MEYAISNGDSFSIKTWTLVQVSIYGNTVYAGLSELVGTGTCSDVLKVRIMEEDILYVSILYRHLVLCERALFFFKEFFIADTDGGKRSELVFITQIFEDETCM